LKTDIPQAWGGALCGCPILTYRYGAIVITPFSQVMTAITGNGAFWAE